jgi:leucyl-tRNA synthetase
MGDNKFKDLEAKWQKEWEAKKAFKAKEGKGKKAYILEMFPYPSGSGLHMGHALNYTIGDIYARFKRMQGNNVLYPMGYDAFGLPAENAAIKAGEHPAKYTEMSMGNFVMQQKALGLSYDWDRKVVTCDPDYYRWNQYFFIKLYEKGLVYRKKSAVNWCPKCNTVLANEQVHRGKCWRHEDTDVATKQLEQWFIRTTSYTEELLDGIKKLNWPERIKLMQENWIGKSFGTEVEFEIAENANYVLLHGFTGTPDGVFLPWLKKELESRGYPVQVPALPNTTDPDIMEQAKYVLANCKFDENTVLLGHSLGCAVALKVLEQMKKPIKKMVLAAGFAQPKFLDKKRPFETRFNWKFDFEKIKKNVNEAVMLRAKNDTAVPQDRSEGLQRELGGRIVDFTAEENHICGTTEPVVLQNCISSWPIFTTRVDTIFGVTFMVVSAQHPRLGELVTTGQKKEADAFLKKLKSVSEKELSKRRLLAPGADGSPEQEALEKEGVFTGSYCINPFTKEKVPIYAGNFVIADYGSGMVMAVPAHDQRDYEFAVKYNIPIKQVISPYIEIKTGKDAVQPDKETIERDSVFGIVKHWSEDKYFLLDWKEHNWRSFVIGGVEKGENAEEAVAREVKEETGYQDIKSIKEVGFETKARYYAEHKGINRKGNYKTFLIELGSDKHITPKEEHVKHHTGEWVEKSRVKNFINLENNSIVWGWYENGLSAYTDYGALINSGEFSGLSSEAAIDNLQKHLEKKGLGKKTFNYKFRDWLVSRQRYWGTPIPMVYCEKCGVQPVPEKNLPVLLPKNVKFGKGNPLATNAEFVNARCPICKGKARRETDTMDTFFDSSWYYLRYCDSQNGSMPFEKKKAEHWMPVDLYIGGAEHATMHLIYARFFTKALRDLGMLKIDEPFPRLFNQGMLHGSDGNKMSKSIGNVVNPIEMIGKYSADSLRFNLMSLASPDSDSNWNDNGMESAHKFIIRIFTTLSQKKPAESSAKVKNKLHKAVKEITQLIESFKYNIALIKIRETFEYIEKEELGQEDLEIFTKLLHPFCPHLTEELWHNLGHKTFICLSSWPIYDEKLIDEKLDASDELVRSTIADINAVKKLIGALKTERITLIIAPKWKYDFYKKIKEELEKTRNPGDIIKAVMMTDLKKHGQEITRLMPALVKDPSKIPDTILSQEAEMKALIEAGEKIEEAFDADLKIFKAEESVEPKAKNASPGKPAIIIS